MIIFCTTCKNRTDHLKRTLPHNLANNPNAKFIVLNYNSEDDLLTHLNSSYPREIEAGRLLVYSYWDAPVFRMAHAKNMAHRLGIHAGANILVNLDADNLTGPGFEDFIGREFDATPDIFLWGHMIKGKMVRGISGRIAVTAQQFIKAGGYDEDKFNGWGSDDKDFNLRLRQLGYDGVAIPPSYLQGISHNNKIRFKEYPHLANSPDDYFEVSARTVTRSVVNNGSIGCGTVYNGEKVIGLDPLPTRIFGIGLHKTGTSSLHAAFAILGYDSWHWSSAHVAKAIWQEMNNLGKSPTLERYYALCDLPIPLLYRQLDVSYPGSKFILTVRDEDSWLNSVQKHWDPEINRYRPNWGSDPFTNRVHQLLYGRTDFNAETMLSRYRRHNAEVMEYFADRPNCLLVKNVDTNGWENLTDFLGASMPSVSYPHENGTPK